jgi:two-component system sensor histidine kinase AlgZ
VQITNTLPAMTITAVSTSGSGMALNNVRERLSLLHDLESTFQAGIKNGQFNVRIELPV